MSEMVERVARAICCPDGCDGDTGSGKPCDIRREGRTSMRQARAAIEAMRQPTNEMCGVFGDAEPEEWLELLPEEVWKSMIDAALSSSL